MKSRLIFAGALIVMGFVIASCQTMTPFSQGWLVAPVDRISLVPGQQTGSWQGENVTVDYKYSRNEHDMDLSGTARFNDNMTMNFQVLHDFHLSAIFTDGDGRVLGSQAITTERGNFDPVPFRARLVPPPGTADISFGYQGAAFSVGNDDGAGGGPTYFWQYPAR